MIKRLPRKQLACRTRPPSQAAFRAGIWQAQGSCTSKKEPSSKLARRRQLSSQDVIGKHPAEVTFFCYLYSELQDSIRFFERTQEENCTRVARLGEGSDILLRRGSNRMEDRSSALARSAFNVFSDLLLLEQYAITTFCAFSKILKKHDKCTGRKTRNAFMTMVSVMQTLTIPVGCKR
jgi:SPX domain protein involved in polyphosphate accumulation